MKARRLVVVVLVAILLGGYGYLEWSDWREERCYVRGVQGDKQAWDYVRCPK